MYSYIPRITCGCEISMKTFSNMMLKNKAILTPNVKVIKIAFECKVVFQCFYLRAMITSAKRQQINYLTLATVALQVPMIDWSKVEGHIVHLGRLRL